MWECCTTTCRIKDTKKWKTNSGPFMNLLFEVTYMGILTAERRTKWNITNHTRTKGHRHIPLIYHYVKHSTFFKILHVTFSIENLIARRESKIAFRNRYIIPQPARMFDNFVFIFHKINKFSKLKQGSRLVFYKRRWIWSYGKEYKHWRCLNLRY